MSLETLAAKKGIELSAKAIRVGVFVLLIGVVCSLAWCTADNIATLRTENASLREYRASNERRAGLDSTASQAASVARGEREVEDAKQADVIVIHDKATKEAANEDPSSASFLRSRIPDRLRRADREARAQRSEPQRDE